MDTFPATFSTTFYLLFYYYFLYVHFEMSALGEGLAADLALVLGKGKMDTFNVELQRGILPKRLGASCALESL